MLFNSAPFLLIFLPLVLVGSWALVRFPATRLWFLIIASLAFYGYWNWLHLPLLIGSVLGNWGLSVLYSRLPKGGHTDQQQYLHTAVVIGAISANLAILGLYKYLGFFGGILNEVVGWPSSTISLILPLGISFFTFHHIIYWMDLRRRLAPVYSLRDYALYIVSFPQLLAGPLGCSNFLTNGDSQETPFVIQDCFLGGRSWKAKFYATINGNV